MNNTKQLISDSTWAEVFEKLQTPPQYVLLGEPTKIQRNDAIRVLSLWNIALHWVIKLEWKKNHKIPCPRKLAEVMKPFGTLVHHYLKLCIQCHSFLKPNPYLTAADWFRAFARQSQENSIFRPPNTKKTESLGIRRDMVNAIADGINSIDKQHAIHEWRIIDTALHFERGQSFDEKHFQPFIRAYRSWITATQTPEWQSLIRENGELYAQQGQGHGKILIDFQKLIRES